MKPNETRIVSSTGGAKGAKDIRLGGADALALLELGRVYGMGEKKYARYNYLRGYTWSLSVDALLRHLLAIMAGQDYDECSLHPGQHGDQHAYNPPKFEGDPEGCDGSGLLHAAHVAWHGLTLASFKLRGIGDDDRFVEPQPPTSGDAIKAFIELPSALAKTPPTNLFSPPKPITVTPAQVAKLPDDWSGGDGPTTSEARIENRGDWPPDTRVGKYLTCCGSTEHTVDCPQWR